MRSNKKLMWLVGIGACVLLLGAGTAVAAGGQPTLLPKPEANQRVQQAIATARAHPRPKVTSARPVSRPLPARRAGTVEMRQGPFPATEFTVRNVWQGQVGDAWLVVYAGAKRQGASGPDQPAVRVYSETPDLHLTLIGTFPVTGAAGPVRVAGASGNLIDVQTDTGAHASFNALTHRFE
jgi:hypothetical protein